MEKDLPAAYGFIQNQTDDWRDMNVEKESPEERELFERMPQHPSREQLMAEVTVLTELVRVLSGRVTELEKTEPVVWNLKDVTDAYKLGAKSPQRTWVDLTKEECFELCVKHKDNSFSLLVAVQEKLMGKNT
jgi:hypothetical protein